MRMVKISILSLVFSLFAFSTQAQDVINMTNGTITVCEGVFEDDGLGGGPYSTTNYTFTICPDNPGDVIQVEFLAFSVATNPNPNNSDRLFIYDGDSPAANSMGNYTGTSLQGLPVTGTVNNTSGCLTFVFNPNPNTPGTFPGWAANITCTTPCDNPTAAYDFLEPVPQGPDPSIGVCIGQTVTMQDAGSVAQPGFSIQNYIWNWGDSTQTITQSPAPVEHAYDEPGEYIINLFVEDNNGCINLNLDPKQVLVSTIPIFNTNFATPVCVGSPTTIDGNPLQSVTWTALPPQVVAGETFLADGAGFAYNSSLLFDFFPSGSTLENCDDLYSIFVNMEHSYLGDLEFFITCPNGTSVTMMSFPNGGGGTFLGEAVDDNTIDNFAPGNGYDYGWSPNSTNGFINDNSNWTQTSFVNNVGITHNVNIVNPGIYESEEDLCQLVGCPLNGEWTFSVTDNLAADNGYIFEWGLEFNPTLFPDVTTFTPVIGLEADSSFWEGPNIINTSANGNSIDVLFDEPGFYEFTMFATNNFACTFDTTIVIEAIIGPEITAGPNLIVCDEPAQLQAGLANVNNSSCANSAGQYEYCYGDNDNIVVTYCPDNPNDGTTFMHFGIESGQIAAFGDAMTVYNGDGIGGEVIQANITGNLAGLSWESTDPSGCITFQITSNAFTSCESGAFDPIVLNVACNGGSDLIWSWTPATGLSNPNVQNPLVLVDQSTTYTVSAYPPDLPGCVIFDEVTVALDPGVDPGIDTDTTICYNSQQSALVGYLQGTPALNGVWTTETGEIVSSQFNPQNFPNGTSLTLTYSLDNGICVKTSTLNLTVLPSSNPICCVTNAFAGPDAVACDLVYQLEAFPTFGTGTWTGPPELSFSDINDPNAIVTCAAPGGTFTLTWTDQVDQFCKETDQVTIVFAPKLEIVLIPTDAPCHGECGGTAIAIPSGGTPEASGIYNYLWSSGEAGITGQVIEQLCAGDHMVRVVDSKGCVDSLEFNIGEPNPQQLIVNTAPPLCADSCNAKVNVFSMNAVEYSYDGGLTWSDENVGYVCAGTHTIIAKNGAECEIAQEVTLIDPPRFEATFNINPNPTTTKNTLIQFQNTSTPGPIAETLFLFGEDGNVGESTERMTQWRFPTDTSGTYPITLITRSVNNCADTLTKLLVINDDLLWYIPNAFSPNQDGINELWRPQGSFIDLTNYRLQIFDRWGTKVFETTEFEQGWNGSKNGSDHFVDTGIYTYFIKVASITTEEVHELNGFIMLIR